MMDRYTGFTHCPYCFESCGYLGDHSAGYDGADSFVMNDNSPCPECNGTGTVPCDPRTYEAVMAKIKANLAAVDHVLAALQSRKE